MNYNIQGVLLKGLESIYNGSQRCKKKDGKPKKLATVIVSGGRGRIVGLGIGAKSVFFTIEF